VELHTGAYCDALRAGDRERSAELLAQLQLGASEAAKRGLEVHAGHGIDFDSVLPVASIPQVVELNIGHFLIGEAIFIGLFGAIGRMRSLMDEARGR
jgi:pyridoxine 5-phosphate synthase